MKKILQQYREQNNPKHLVLKISFLIDHSVMLLSNMLIDVGIRFRPFIDQ